MIKIQTSLQFFKLVKDVFENQWVEYGGRSPHSGEMILHSCDVILSEGDDYEPNGLLMYVVKT
jgi:hypothetical protein